MAFTNGTLERVSGGNSDAGVVWKYEEDATIAAIRGANYFNKAVDYGVKADDVILIIANNGVGFNTFSVTGVNYTMTASRALTFA
tara:strand:+ start:454 stop:708 length:255 start_codon:yes stop_codon:yes gene_type:complete